MTLRWRTIALLGAAAAAAVAAAWLLGLPELAALAAVGWVAAALSAATLALRPGRPRVEVTVAPPVVERGAPAHLELRFAPDPAGRSFPYRVLARMGTAGQGVLAAGSAAGVRLPLPTPHRGLVPIGPLTATLSDPLGWWRRDLPLDASGELLVRPRAHLLGRWNPPGGRQPAPGRRGANAPVGVHGEDDLAGLRPYVPGDDLRRVHWRTSARTGEPHVVQVEPPARAPAVAVVLDRSPASEAEAFERAVEAAASVLATAAAAGRSLQLLGTDLPGARPAAAPRGPDALPDLLDALALVTPGPGAVAPALEAVDRSSTSVVLCSGLPAALAPEVLGRVDALVDCAPPGGGRHPGQGVPTARWDGATPLAEAWAAAGTRGDAAGAPAGGGPR